MGRSRMPHERVRGACARLRGEAAKAPIKTQRCDWKSLTVSRGTAVPESRFGAGAW